MQLSSRLVLVAFGHHNCNSDQMLVDYVTAMSRQTHRGGEDVGYDGLKMNFSDKRQHNALALIYENE